MWIDIAKVNGGFEYSIGQLVIARGRWVKSKGAWLLRVYHMKFNKEAKYGVAALDMTEPMLPRDVIEYLQSKLQREM